jgi:NAD(P)H-hydrate epimerase
MATGGMGDVLTGVIAGLRGQRLEAFAAASAGALLHGLAGDAAAARRGQRGLLASDLFDCLPTLANPQAAG